MAETNGFYYMRARYYDPLNGRFISEDPLGFDGGDVNLYVYSGNNPVLLVDPWGLSGQNWMFHSQDHGGPHFQKGYQRYDSKTLEPIPHKGKIPPELSKSLIRDNRAVFCL